MCITVLVCEDKYSLQKMTNMWGVSNITFNREKRIVKLYSMRIRIIMIVQTLKSCTPIRIRLTTISAYELKLM